MSESDWVGFWRWLFKGSGAKPGYRRLINSWLIIHGIIGLGIAFLVRIDLVTAANTVLLPLAAVLVGLSFTWAGNAQALLQASEIEKLSEFHSGGFMEYVFMFQLAILVILTTLVAWAMAGFQVFDKLWPTPACASQYFALKAFLFLLSSLTLRECWHVVLGAQWMLLVRHQIKKRGL